MNIYIAGLVILLTSLLTFCMAGALTARPVVDRLADPAPMPGELPRAGYLPGPPYAYEPRSQAPGWYGPFPVDTGPLLIVSDTTAANDKLEREVKAMVAEAEAKIPPRWRS